jgi:hypothetical protein
MTVEQSYSKIGWAICDHPNYGLPFGMASYERAGAKEIQGFNVKRWDNCDCNLPRNCPIDCPCDDETVCHPRCMSKCTTNKPTAIKPEL